MYEYFTCACTALYVYTYMCICAFGLTGSGVHWYTVYVGGGALCMWLGHTVHTYMHSICNTLSIKSSKKQVLVFSVQTTVNICRTINVHVCMWFSSRYMAVVSLAIFYKVYKKPCNILIPTNNWKLNMHAQRHVLPWIHASIHIFIQYLTITIQPDVSIDVNCCICYRWHFRTCIAADGVVLNR